MGLSGPKAKEHTMKDVMTRKWWQLIVRYPEGDEDQHWYIVEDNKILRDRDVHVTGFGKVSMRAYLVDCAMNDGMPEPTWEFAMPSEQTKIAQAEEGHLRYGLLPSCENGGMCVRPSHQYKDFWPAIIQWSTDLSRLNYGRLPTGSPWELEGSSMPIQFKRPIRVGMSRQAIHDVFEGRQWNLIIPPGIWIDAWCDRLGIK